MRNENRLRIVGLALVAALLVATTVLHADVRAPMTAADCEITTTEQLAIRAGEQEIKVTVTEALGASPKAAFANASNVKVVSVTADVVANTFKLKADASAATAGDWELTITSGDVSCKGDVKVVGAETAAR
jgi:hypothetical protein